MIDSNSGEKAGQLYGRLLQRVAQALEEADTAVQLRHEQPQELVLQGLSRAEVELIRAYREQDLPWLRGWHAAVEELSLIEQQAPFPLEPSASRRRSLTRAARGVTEPGLSCALCGTVAHWAQDFSVGACGACGSRLFQGGKPR
jgi:hypothetical protein